MKNFKTTLRIGQSHSALRKESHDLASAALAHGFIVVVAVDSLRAGIADQLLLSAAVETAR